MPRSARRVVGEWFRNRASVGGREVVAEVVFTTADREGELLASRPELGGWKRVQSDVIPGLVIWHPPQVRAGRASGLGIAV